MNILNSSEAFSAMMAGKNIMCRAVGELIEFDDLNQFPATIFAQPGYEFCIKRETTVLAEIQFTKPVEPHDLEVGQEIYIVMPTCILRTQYDNEHGDICLSIANGFAQLDEENAKLQLQAFGKAFGNMITEIEVKDGFNDKPKKTRASRKKTEDKVEESATTDAIEASVETAPVSKSRPAFTVDDVAEIETDANAIIEKFTTQISNCTTTDAVLSLRPIFFANGHLEREQQQHLCKLTEDKLLELDPEQYAPKQINNDHQIYIDGINACVSEDEIKTTLRAVNDQGFTEEQISEINCAKSCKLAEFQTIALEKIQNNQYQNSLNELLKRAESAATPAEANALYKHTMQWTEEQRKPLLDAIHKRLNELNPPEKSESSLMVRINEASNLIELAKLEEEISKCDPLIQERMMGYANQRRTDLIDAVDLPWETADET